MSDQGVRWISGGEDAVRTVVCERDRFYGLILIHILFWSVLDTTRISKSAEWDYDLIKSFHSWSRWVGGELFFRFGI